MYKTHQMFLINKKNMALSNHFDYVSKQDLNKFKWLLIKSLKKEP